MEYWTIRSGQQRSLSFRLELINRESPSKAIPVSNSFVL